MDVTCWSTAWVVSASPQTPPPASPTAPLPDGLLGVLFMLSPSSWSAPFLNGQVKSRVVRRITAPTYSGESNRQTPQCEGSPIKRYEFMAGFMWPLLEHAYFCFCVLVDLSFLLLLSIIIKGRTWKEQFPYYLSSTRQFIVFHPQFLNLIMTVVGS